MDTTDFCDSARRWPGNGTQLPRPPGCHSYSQATLPEPQVQYEPDNAQRHSQTPPCHRYDHPSIPPKSETHSIPSPAQNGYNMYYQSGRGETQETPYTAEFTVVNSAGNSSQNKLPRTMLACGPCRSAKVRCTNQKPCQGCREKGIDCINERPAPKKMVVPDIIGRLDEMTSELNRLHEYANRVDGRQRLLEKALITRYPRIFSFLDQSDEEEAGDNDFDNDSELSEKSRKAKTNAKFEGDVNDSGDWSDGQVAGYVPPGEPAIPIGHTTGAAKILQWSAVAAMIHKKMNYGNTYIDPLQREMLRSAIPMCWRGERVERSPRHDKDSLSDCNLKFPRSSSDTYSEAAHSPTTEQRWARYCGQSPVADSYLFKAKSEGRTAVDLTAFSQLDDRTVRRLAQSYMRHLNVMHPIITQKSLDEMITNFKNQIGGPEKEGPAYDYSSLVGPELVGSKRKRSPTVSVADEPYAEHLDLEWNQKTISEAVIALILALGKVCEHEIETPDVVHVNRISTLNSSLNPISTPLTQQSPQSSSTVPSPIMQDGAHSGRSFTDASRNRHPIATRNLDAIPGHIYFVFATDIMKNHTDTKDLSYVHACLLASLYQSQLSRVLQSHAYVKKAGCALTIILKQHLPRYEQMQKDMGNPEKQQHVEWHPEDNRILFAYWTCLQLECDILAELELPQSGILSLESIMPWPNLAMALDNNEMSAMEMRCYSVQLVLRKKLNIIHRELYGPGKENEYQLARMNKLDSFPYIDAMLDDFNVVMEKNPALLWRDGDPPARNILEARLRAKMYGAQVITCRHFLRMVLNSRYEEKGGDMEISAPIMEFAKKCICAMFYSAQAFWGIKGRLVVTNVWGTSHAQWGNAIVLHAAYMDPMLQPYVPAHKLVELTLRVREFLVSVAHPRSALADNIRILDYAAGFSGAREAAAREVAAVV